MEDPNVPQQPQQPQAPQYAPQQPQAPQYGPQPQYQQPYQQPHAPQYAPQQPYQQYQAVPTPTNGLGVAGFVLSLIGLVLFFVPFLDVLSALIGVILSGFGMKKKPNGLAIAGLVIGIIAFIVGLIWTIGAIVAVDTASRGFRW
ncbi:MAG: hypothetical protein J6X63_02355 [Bacteroidales bacterium]|nr:hypothetical protein [Bacteroidales bacterium]